MSRMLKNKKKYGGAHTETIHLRNCVPKHIRGQKVVDEAISELFTKGILITKTALIPDLKVGVFDRAVLGIENSPFRAGVFHSANFQ